MCGDARVTQVQAGSDAQQLPWPSLVVDATPEAFFEAIEMSVQTVPQVWLINAAGEVVHRVEEVLSEDGVADLAALLATLRA